MNPPDTEKTPKSLSADEMQSALFANLVLQQANMALMLMGRTPHPESGETMVDLEGAQFMIDQLEMIQAKTKGNLTSQEEQLLQQSLTNLRMAFVEAVNAAPATESSPPKSPPAQPSASAGPQPANDTAAEKEKEEASRVKYSKKY